MQAEIEAAGPIDGSADKGVRPRIDWILGRFVEITASTPSSVRVSALCAWAHPVMPAQRPNSSPMRRSCLSPIGRLEASDDRTPPVMTNCNQQFPSANRSRTEAKLAISLESCAGHGPKGMDRHDDMCSSFFDRPSIGYGPSSAHAVASCRLRPSLAEAEADEHFVWCGRRLALG